MDSPRMAKHVFPTRFAPLFRAYLRQLLNEWKTQEAASSETGYSQPYISELQAQDKPATIQTVDRVAVARKKTVADVLLEMAKLYADDKQVREETDDHAVLVSKLYATARSARTSARYSSEMSEELELIENASEKSAEHLEKLGATASTSHQPHTQSHKPQQDRPRRRKQKQAAAESPTHPNGKGEPRSPRGNR